MIPKSLTEFRCVVERLIAAGAFDSVGTREEMIIEPAPCQRLVGALFCRAVEAYQPDFVTITTDESMI